MNDLKNFAEVQAALDAFVEANKLSIASAPHGPLWSSCTNAHASYMAFVTGDVIGQTDPKTGDSIPIMVKFHSKDSNIILILQGKGYASDFGQMPRTKPPYPGQDEIITQLAGWIDAGCPEF